MYRIVKVLNNNVAVVHTSDNKQAVVMGRGVAFQKKKGDLIDEHKVQKVFATRDEHTVSDLTTLMASIPLDFITTSYELIGAAQRKFNFAVESYIDVTLTTHLFAAYQRLQSKSENVNYLPDLSKNYPTAYKMADYILQGFADKLNIHFPAFERKNVALQFINAYTDQVKPKREVEVEPNRNEKIVSLVKDVLQRNGIVRKQKNDSDYDRLLVHLKYFINRLNNDHPDTLQISEQMKKAIMTEYAAAWKITNEIGVKMQDQLQITLSLTEKTYLTIHIQRLL